MSKSLTEDDIGVGFLRTLVKKLPVKSHLRIEMPDSATLTSRHISMH